MKTCVLYGPKDLRIEERPVSEPQPGFVRLRMGGVGICGSDLHYYHIGRVGNAVVREPMILGHELSGVVDAIGPGVSGLVPGQKVIINPTDECGTCGYCRSGHQNLCPDLRYYGSAARTPHVQGIMVEYPMVQARQCVAVSDAMPLDQAACVEPLAIALHAVARAGNLLGKRVFVSGVGPVGCLIAAVARLNGAASVAVSDMEEFPLSVAVKLGADAVFKATDPTLADLANGCEACFEASGSVGGMNTCLRSAAPGGTVVHVGFLGEEEVAYPINTTTEGAIKVVIEGEEGHKASIVANRVSAQTTNNSDNSLMLVREDISKLKDKIYLHDIIGGIGYIVGIFGLWALIRASKMTRASQSKER